MVYPAHVLLGKTPENGFGTRHYCILADFSPAP